MGDKEKFAQEVQVVEKDTEHKLKVNADGTLPVEVTGGGQTDALTDAELRAASVSVTDTNPPQTDALTDAQLRAADVGVDTGLSQPLTDAQLRLTDVGVDTGLAQPVQDGGTVNVGNLPASQSVDDGGGSLTVDGTVAVTGTQQDALTNTQLRAADVGVDTGLSQPLTDAQLRFADVGVDTGLAQPVQDGGTVNVGNLPASQTVDDGGGSITVDGTVAVTGTQQDALTNTQLRAAAVSVTDTNPPQTDALTDAQLRLTDVGVDTGLTQPLTDAQLRATSVPVDTGLAQPVQPGDSVDVGNFPASQSVDDGGGSLTVDGTVAVTGTQQDALTDAELRAAPLPVVNGTDREIFGAQSVLSRTTDVFVSFDQGVPSNRVVSGGSGTLSAADAQARLSADVGETAWLRSLQPVRYRPGYEAFGGGTARIAGAANGSAYFGLLSEDTNDGYLIHADAGVLEVERRSNGAVTTDVPNGDPLDGSAGSTFTRGGAPEAIDLSMVNVFRIRFGWYGSAPILLEVMAPDGHWVVLHTIRQPNSETSASIQNPNLHAYIEAQGVGGTIDVYSSSFGIGAMLPARDAVVDQGNSGSAIAIPDGQAFTGEWVDLYQFAQVNVTLDADEPLSMDFEFSDDAVTSFNDTVPTFTHDGGGTTRRFQFGVYAQYFRVRLTNNSGSPATVRMQTSLLPSEGGVSIGRIGDVLTDDRSVTSVKAVQAAKAPDGNYYNLPTGGVDPDNSTQVPLLDGESFTGDWLLTRGYQSFQAFAFSDQPFTTAKLVWSADGVTPKPGLIGETDLLGTQVFVSGFYVYLVVGTTMIDSYVRMELSNEADPAADQTVMEAALWMYEGPFPGSFGQLDDDLSSLSTALLVRAVQAGVQPDGEIVNVPASGQAWETTAPLLADGDVTSPWIDTDGFESIEVYVTSDVVSATGGLEIEFTADAQAETPQVAGQPLVFEYGAQALQFGQRVIRIPPTLDGFRVRYTNGDTDQTNFRLTATLHTGLVDLSRVELGAAIPSSAFSALLTRGALVAADDAGQFESIGRDGDGGALTTEVRRVDEPVKLQPTTRLRTGQIQVVTGGDTPIPVPSEFVVGTVSVTNPSADTNVYVGLLGVTEFTGDVILPLATKDIDYDMDGDGGLALVAGSGGGQSNPNLLTLFGDSTTGSTGVPWPDDALTLNSFGADVESGDHLEVSGFDGVGSITADTISKVELVMEARKESGQFGETAAFVDTVTGVADNLTSVSTGLVTASPDDLYVVAVSRRDVNADVVQITDGLGISGGSGWTLIADESDADESRTTMWYGSGASTNGAVTVDFDIAADYAALSVTRLSGVDLNSPIHSFEVDNGNSSVYASGLSLDTASSSVMMAVVGAESMASHTPGAGWTERAEFGSSSPNDQRQAVSTDQTGGNPRAWGGTFGGSRKYSAIAVSFNPSPALDPRALLGYEVSGSPGATTQERQWPSETFEAVRLDVTGDRAWVVADIDNLSITVDSVLIGNAALEVDVLYVEVTEADTVVRCTYMIVGEDAV